MTKIYVRNLEADVTEHSIRTLFEEYGAVERVRINKQRPANRSFAFVEMTDAVSAGLAIEALHQSERGDRVLHVIVARPTRVVTATAPPDKA